jgi:hypothetical protein
VAHRYGYGYGVERTSHWAVPVPGGWAIITGVHTRGTYIEYPSPGVPLSAGHALAVLRTIRALDAGQPTG